MIFLGKYLDEVDRNDFQKLIGNRVQENRSLEYKSQMYGKSDSEAREMLRDISAMANAYGGFILIGISEDDDGCAIKIEGIDDGNIEAQRIIDSCHNNIDNKIQGLYARAIDIEEGKSIILIYIPWSLRAPHMITFKGMNQFWIRHARHKIAMDVEEIKDKVTRRDDMRKKIEEFIAKRDGLIREKIGDGLWFVISMIPPVLEAEVIDIFNNELRDIIIHSPTMVKGDRNINCGFPEPSLEGLIAEEMREYPKDRHGRYLVIYREGYVEFAECWDWLTYPYYKEIYKVIPAKQVTQTAINFCAFIDKLTKIFSFSEPIMIRIKIFNARGCIFLTKANPDEQSFKNICQYDDLDLKALQFEKLDDPEKVARVLMDRLWNAFHYEKSLHFDENEKYTIKGE